MKKDKKINKNIERTIFFIITMLGLIPILANNFFVTLDGPAHLYNSCLIKNMIFDNKSILNEFYSFNNIPLPNWLGHSLLIFLQIIISARYAEKILLIIYIIAFPYSFRYLIRQLTSRNNFLSYLIFPFTFSFFLFLGFYNFLLSVILLFISLAYWVKTDREGYNFKKSIVLFLLFLLTYFAHIFSFLWLLISISLYIFSNFLQEYFRFDKSFKKIFAFYLKKVFYLLVVALVPITFALIYFYSNPSFINKTYLHKSELIGWLKNIRPIIALNFEKEEVYTKKILYIVGGLFSIALYFRISKLNFHGERLKEKIISFFRSSFKVYDIWLCLAIILLFLYFFLPDSDGNAGYISVRLAFLFFLFLILWICVQPFNKRVGIIVASITICCYIMLNNYYTKEQKKLSIIAKECYETSKYIAPKTVLLPVNYTDNWLFSHISNYLGIDKPIVILENYEAENKYFPLRWRENGIPTTIIGTGPNLNCYSWIKRDMNKKPVKIDYILFIGNNNIINDSCTTLLIRNLNDHFNLVHFSKNIQLFRSK